MASTLTASEEGQLRQTIEMFEVITQSQPDDYQSLEILQEAYSKLGQEDKAMATACRIAEAYVKLGQYSSAIMEYESILQRYPDNPQAQAALQELESKANNFGDSEASDSESDSDVGSAGDSQPVDQPELDTGRDGMFKVFVEGNILTPTDFDVYWDTSKPGVSQESFVECLASRGILGIEESLKLLSEKCRMAYLPMEMYDVDMEFARNFPRETCWRWNVIPFDRMSKVVMAATANPFNKQAAYELQQVGGGRLVWYLSHPMDIATVLRKVFR